MSFYSRDNERNEIIVYETSSLEHDDEIPSLEERLKREREGKEERQRKLEEKVLRNFEKLVWKDNKPYLKIGDSEIEYSSILDIVAKLPLKDYLDFQVKAKLMSEEDASYIIMVEEKNTPKNKTIVEKTKNTLSEEDQMSKAIDTFIDKSFTATLCVGNRTDKTVSFLFEDTESVPLTIGARYKIILIEE